MNFTQHIGRNGWNGIYLDRVQINLSADAMTLHDFVKAAPEGFRPRAIVSNLESYKYFVRGKGCTLGVLFEDSVNVYFEWLKEDGRAVSYPPEIRYKAWPKHEFARLMAAGVWHPTCAEASGA